MGNKKILFIMFFSNLIFGVPHTSFGTAIFSGQKISFTEKKLTIMIPSSGEKAYRIAGEAFSDLWNSVLGELPRLNEIKTGDLNLPDGDLVLIGSDAVNPLVHNMILSGELETLDIVYGSDNYRILSVSSKGRTCLIIAGGNGRSTIYAVYDFFRRQAGVEYFWDGDVIPKLDQIKISGIDVYEQPHFEYRGLRYFAHRGLSRFQAEHWDIEDWKKEIDWLVKKRFNLFMIRTGVDDLFQRAFPDAIPYPPVDAQHPLAIQRSYKDRTSFWQLIYRGELRKEVMMYARDRGLIHPEDAGIITHWYSPFPGSLYANYADSSLILNQKNGNSLPAQANFDIESEIAWDSYWKLTETHIREFGGSNPAMFHTIGTAERTLGKNERENLQSKLYVYRRTQQMIRDKYPNAPLLIGSWDFTGGRWKDEDVQKLIKELDPKNTIILDYTSDKSDKVSYQDWALQQKFPWIFGIFHSYVKNSDIHEDYNVIAPRIKDAANDNKCIGLVTWSEISHSDTYFLEYIADNSWKPQRLETAEATKRYCFSRYTSDVALVMEPLWNAFLNLSQTLHWGSESVLFNEPQFRVLTTGAFINLTPEKLDKLEKASLRIYPELKKAPEVLRALSEMADKCYENQLWKRDALDMARTIGSRAYFLSIAQGVCQMEHWRQRTTDSTKILLMAKLSQELLASLAAILSMSDDFSMYSSLVRLSNAEEINGIMPLLNPYTEQTLKGNAENGYCRSHQYELLQYVYLPELAVYWNWVLGRVKSNEHGEWKRPGEFSEREKIIVDNFYKTPLSELAPTLFKNSSNMKEILQNMQNNVIKLIKVYSE